MSTPLVGLVDTALMGHMGRPAFLAAVAAGAMIFSVLFMSLNFLRMGTTGLAGQAFGSGQKRAMASSLSQPMVFALALAVALLVLQNTIIDASLWLITPSPETAARAEEYFYIRIWSAPMALTNFVLIGWLIGMQNARGPLAIILTINLVNVILGVLLVIYAGLDIRGVAAATVLAELAGLMVGLRFVRAIFRAETLDWSQSEALEFSGFRRLLAINGNLFIRSIALMFTFAFITAQGARFGDLTLAANALLMNFQLFLSYALDGIAHAAEALTGKAAGSRNHHGLALAVRRGLLWTLLLAAGFTIVYALAGIPIINMLTDLDDIRTTAYRYLPWVICLPLLSAGAFLYDGVFVGTTRSREMRISMTAATVLVFLPVWYVFTDQLENHALWLAFVSFMAVRSLVMHLWYRRLMRTGALIG